MLDRFTPDPEPPWKMMPSSVYQLRIDRIVSSTARMKHADACAGAPLTPMLNHTGELKAARWLATSEVSSAWNASASVSSTK